MLDISKLKIISRASDKIIAECPICTLTGSKNNNHLVVFTDTLAFGCVRYQGDKEHYRLIYEYLKGENIEFEPPEPKLQRKKFDKTILDTLLQNTFYWEKRGISEQTVREFSGGVSQGGPMYQRYVFPIYNNKNELVGCSGRSITNREPKWKLKGKKTDGVFPFHLNKQDIVERQEVILTEGISDILALFEAGFRQSLCLFGVTLSNSIVNQLVQLNIRRIIIATNRDIKHTAGQEAAIKIKAKLGAFFDENKIIIALPELKDFGELLEYKGKQSIIDWYKGIGI
jgi:5S rRNA maturation endonuclease (ribonuclease M5)